MISILRRSDPLCFINMQNRCNYQRHQSAESPTKGPHELRKLQLENRGIYRKIVETVVEKKTFSLEPECPKLRALYLTIDQLTAWMKSQQQQANSCQMLTSHNFVKGWSSSHEDYVLNIFTVSPGEQNSKVDHNADPKSFNRKNR